MSLLNQPALEAIFAGAFLRDYIDILEHMPLDIQRCVSSIRMIDVRYREIVGDLERHKDSFKELSSEGKKCNPSKKKHLIHLIHRSLLQAQEIGDLKLSVVSDLQSIIDSRSKVLKTDRENLESGGTSILNNASDNSTSNAKDTATSLGNSLRSQNKIVPTSIGSGNPSVSTSRSIVGGKPGVRRRNADKLSQDMPLAKKLRKQLKSTKALDKMDVIDEATYCLCGQVSYGEMVGCDNSLCSIEWFHFACVDLIKKPAGKWYCPECRLSKDKSHLKKPATKR